MSNKSLDTKVCMKCGALYGFHDAHARYQKEALCTCGGLLRKVEAYIAEIVPAIPTQSTIKFRVIGE